MSSIPHGIASAQRFSRRNPCPICGGGDNDRRGRSVRCSGYLSENEEYAYCTREEYAGMLSPHPNTQPPAFAHRLQGPCKCGSEHNPIPFGQDPRDLHAPVKRDPSAPRELRKIVATYDYRDASGALRYQVVRYEPKTFRQRRPDGRGDWTWNLSTVTPVLYRLPELLRSDPKQFVFVVEGEKDADALTALGLIATTNAGGAGKWHTVPGAGETLRNRHVAILPDNDDAGRKHAKEVADDLVNRASSVRVVYLPNLPEKGDVSNWLRGAGNDAARLLTQVEATPRIEPEPEQIIGTIIADVERQAVRWLWTGRLALGKMAIFDGDPGLGKGLMGVDIAARLTTGRPLPGETEAMLPCNVIMLTPEDDPADTIRPRLESAGADLKRIRILDVVKEVDPETGRERDRMISIPRDLPAIEAAIKRDQARVLIIDPIMGCLDPGVKTSVDSEVRAALMPLKQMVERLGTTVMLVRHLNKGGGDKALYRGQGSIAFSALCRTAFIVGAHPDGDDKRVLASAKSNIARLAPSLSFSIIERAPQDVYIEWDSAPCGYDADSLMAARKSEERRDIVRVLTENYPIAMSPSEIAQELGVDADKEVNIRMRLSRMLKAGDVESPARGKYTIRKSVTSVTSVTNVTSVTPVTTSQYEDVTGADAECNTPVTFPQPRNSQAREVECNNVTDVTPRFSSPRTIPPCPNERHQASWVLSQRQQREICPICHPEF